jgi:tetratricopeptide (TPR) repeat protein
MRWRFVIIFLAGLYVGGGLVWLGASARAAEEGAPDRQAPLFENLADYHHPISTKVPLAQRYFDQGMVLCFAFNHAEAVRSFQEAARLDPACAMCHWGAALALGPNINAAMDAQAGRQAYEAVEQALRLAPGVSEAEQAYISALATRYAAEPPADRKALDKAYANAMRELSRRYPDDLDAATLFAEALMDTTPWEYWTEDGQPGPLTPELLSTLEGVLARAPNHPMAIHLYIHAVEASPDPGRAEAAADRLVGLVPWAGHLVHMPAHIYLRVGRYGDAAAVNEKAAAADEAYLAQTRAQGLYAMGYYPHNIHFLWYASLMEGRSAVALRAARKLVGVLPPEQVRAFRELEQALPVPLFTLAQFQRWDDVMAEPEPPSDFVYTRAMWHYARGLAFVAKGGLDDAVQEKLRLEAMAKDPAVQSLETGSPPFPARRLVGIATHVLTAEIAGRQARPEDMIRELEEAVKLQDKLPYMEPPYWYASVRQSLGAALLRAGRAKDAEVAYREDLKRHAHSGWSLAGLAASLRAQGKRDAAGKAQREFEAMWSHADVPLPE